MPSFEFVLNFLHENFENVKVNGNQVMARCVLCGDSVRNKRKRRFNLKFKDRDTVWHCWNCGESGSFYKLYSIIKKVETGEAYRECESIGSLFGNISFDKPYNGSIKPPPISNFNWIRQQCLTESNKTHSIIERQYIKALQDFRRERNIPTEIELLVAHKGEYAGRFIIPSCDKDGNIIYFQGRRIAESLKPKYKNPAFPKESIIPNFDFFNPDLPVIITEGLLDCYTLGHQGTACLGKEINENFIKRIRHKCKDIVIALDNDPDGRKAILKFVNSKFGREVRYFIMPKKYKHIKDISELSGVLDEDVYGYIINNIVDYTKIISVIELGENI